MDGSLRNINLTTGRLRGFRLRPRTGLCDTRGRREKKLSSSLVMRWITGGLRNILSSDRYLMFWLILIRCPNSIIYTYAHREWVKSAKWIFFSSIDDLEDVRDDDDGTRDVERLPKFANFEPSPDDSKPDGTKALAGKITRKVQ